VHLAALLWEIPRAWDAKTNQLTIAAKLQEGCRMHRKSGCRCQLVQALICALCTHNSHSALFMAYCHLLCHKSFHAIWTGPIIPSPINPPMANQDWNHKFMHIRAIYLYLLLMVLWFWSQKHMELVVVYLQLSRIYFAL